MNDDFTQLIARVTRGRPYCFMIMTFRQDQTFFENLRTIIRTKTGLACIRADDLKTSGVYLRDKIHALIDSAVFVVADISVPSPNIYYEVGYTVAQRRQLLLLARKEVEIPTDLDGLEMILYKDDSDGLRLFETALRQYLSIHHDRNVSLLRAMLLPQDPDPSYVVAEPKKPVLLNQPTYHPRERSTWGDQLGVVGIMSAFGSVYGEHCVPELLSAEHIAQFEDEHHPRLWDGNFYLIASPLSNRLTRVFLDDLQRKRTPKWQFEIPPTGNSSGPCETQLCSYGLESGDFRSPLGYAEAVQEGRHEDYGLIVRGPHPVHKDRMVMILAGPHSLGTGAACLAATKSPLIRKISDRLGGEAQLMARDQALWVLVKGMPDINAHLYTEGVSIVNAGFYQPCNRKGTDKL